MDASASGTVLITPEVAAYSFLTAWSPPLPVVEAASLQWPELEFVLRFAEPGEGFAGEIKWVAGDALEQTRLTVEDVLAPEERWF